MRAPRDVLLVSLALAGVLVGSLSADALGQAPGVTLPTLPTVTVPTVTVPDITVPDTGGGGGGGGGGGSGGGGGGGGAGGGVPDASDVEEAVESVTSSLTGGGSGSGSGGSSASSSGSSGSRSAERRNEASREDPKLHTSRKKFKNRRERGEPYGTVLSFWLRRPATVRFLIRREAPDCAVVGSFTRRGQRGVNRVRFLGRYGGEALPAGTYRITAVAVRGERTKRLGSVRVVIVPPGRETEDARAQPSTCEGGSAVAGSDASALATLAGGDVAAQPGKKKNKKKGKGVAGAAASSPHGTPDAPSGGVLGVLPNPFDGVPLWLQLLLLALLALAIVLLLLAALPAPALRPTSAATFVARRRADLALTGALVLAGVAAAAFVL